MIVKNIVFQEANNRLRLEATLHFENSPPETSSFYVELPLTNTLPPNPGDAILVSLSLPAMILGERLRIEGAVSRDLAEAECDKVLPMMAGWFPRLSALELECELADPLPPLSAATACLFSGGLDSWRSLFEWQDDISYLVHINGFEINLTNRLTWSRAHESVSKVARNFDKRVLTIETDLRHLILQRIRKIYPDNWKTFFIGYWSGHLLVGIAQLLRPFINRLIIPGSYTEEHEKVATAHSIEPVLGTSSLDIVLDSIGETRIVKAAIVNRLYPGFIDNLRVCMDNTGRTLEDKLNCGQCSKCFRTSLELRLAHVSKFRRPFANLLPVDQGRIKKGFCIDVRPWQYIAKTASDLGEHEIVEAAEMILGRHRFKRRMLRFRERLTRNFIRATSN